MSFNGSLKVSMSLCCELSKVMHSRDKVQLTGMHHRQGLDSLNAR